MNTVYLTIKSLAVVGIILALYLLWQQFFHPSFQPCKINSMINCDAIISGAVAKTLGIPTPLYGLTGYIIIFFAAMFHKKKLLFTWQHLVYSFVYGLPIASCFNCTSFVRSALLASSL